MWQLYEATSWSSHHHWCPGINGSPSVSNLFYSRECPKWLQEGRSQYSFNPSEVDDRQPAPSQGRNYTIRAGRAVAPPLFDGSKIKNLQYNGQLQHPSSGGFREVRLVRTNPVADLGGVRGVQMHPPLAASNVFCVHNCTSPSNDYAAVACSNNNQAQLHTHVSVPYWSPDVWLGLELLRDIQFGPRGPPRRASAYEISKSTGFHVDFGFFWISQWISGFQFGFLPTGFFLNVLGYFSYSSQLSKKF